jgi:hypothetical protein
MHQEDRGCRTLHTGNSVSENITASRTLSRGSRIPLPGLRQPQEGPNLTSSLLALSSFLRLPNYLGDPDVCYLCNKNRADGRTKGERPPLFTEIHSRET